MADEVGALKVGLSIDSAKFEKSLASVDRNLKALGGEMAIVRARGKEWGDSTEGLTAKQKTLSTMLELQDVKVKKLNDAHKKAVEEQGANSKAAENLAIKLNKATAEYTKTETELNDVNSTLNKQQTDLNKTSRKWDDLAVSVKKSSDKLDEFGTKMKDTGGTLSTNVTAPILAAGVGVGLVANQFDTAQGKIQAQLGLTAEEAEKLSDVAEGVWKNSFGESISEVSDNLAIIKQNIKGLNNGELQEFAEGAYTIKDAFGAEINETTRTASVLMKNFGITGNKALDLITTGFQKGGNFSDELLDTLREYAPQFKGMGYDAEEFTAILIAGAESGAFNLDKIGDAAKEAFIRIGDGSKNSRGSLKELGLDFEQIEKDINSGGESAKSSFAAVTAAIATVKDPAKKAQLAIALLGTPIEDLGPEFQDFFAEVNTDLGNFQGATKKAGDALYDNFGSRLQGEFRKFTSSLEPAGEILLEIAEDWLPKLADATEDVLGWFEGLTPESQKLALSVAGITAAAGPALVVVGSLSTGLSSVLKVASPLIGTLGKAGLAGSFVGLANPIGLTVAGLGLLTVAVGAGAVAYKEANEINLEVLETKQKEIDRNDKLIESFDALRSKNQLSNEQMLRYLDIQAELEATNAPEKVAALKDEQAKLLEKSTLTNDQMDEFLVLNDKVIDTAPNTVKAISSEGEAFATNTQALKELNAEKAKQLEQAAYETLVKSLEKEKGLLNDQKQLISEINEKNALQQQTKQTIGQLTKDIKDQEALILDLENQKNTASLEEIQGLDNKIRREKDILYEKENQKLRAEEMIITYGKQMDKRSELLETNRKEIALAEEARFKYEEIILAQAGITAERGRGGEQLSEELNKLEAQKTKLSELLQVGKIGTQEYQEQNGKIDTQISKLQTAKSELQLINDVAGKTVYKEVVISDNPKNFWDTLDANLSRPITKTVSIRYNNMNGPQEPGFATGTRYAPGGMALVGEEGPELMYVPKGARIIPNDDSKTLLNKWNIPSDQSSSTGSSRSYSGSVVNNFYGNNFSPSEIARKQQQAQRQMALQWGV